MREYRSSALLWSGSIQFLRFPRTIGQDLQETGQLKPTLELMPNVRPLMRLTRNAPAPMALFDPQGRYLAGSKSWEQITKIRRQDYYGKTIEVAGAGLPPNLVDLHQRARRGEHFVNAEERYVDAEGVERWLSCEYRPIIGSKDVRLDHWGDVVSVDVVAEADVL